jgi:hypothetical protein
MNHSKCFVALVSLCVLAGCEGRDAAQDNAELKNRIVRLEKEFVARADSTGANGESVPALELFEASDATGHLVSRGHRLKLPDGNYLRAGEWTFFFPDGRTQMKGEFKNDVKVGRWTVYRRQNETIEYQADYKNGDEVYRIVFYAEPNVKNWEGPRRDGKSIGEGSAYRIDGSREATQVRDEKSRLQSWRMFRRDGAEFATFAEDKFTIDGVLQDPVKSTYNDVTNVWDSPISVAWTIAIKRLREEEGK